MKSLVHIPIRILLIDDSSERVVTLTNILSECGYNKVTSCDPSAAVIDLIVDIDPHVILIDVMSPTRDTLEQLRSIRDEHPTPIVLMSQEDRIQTIESAFRCGVTAYVSRDMNRKQVKPIIDTAMLTFASFQHLRNELSKAQQRLENQKVVNRAKGILMGDHGLSEDVAYHKLRRYAMDQGRTIPDVARQIIDIKKLTS